MSKKSQNYKGINEDKNGNSINVKFVNVPQDIDFNGVGGTGGNKVFRGASAQVMPAMDNMFDFGGPQVMQKGSNNKTMIKTQIAAAPMSKMVNVNMNQPINVGGKSKNSGPDFLLSIVPPQEKVDLNEYKMEIPFVASKVALSGGLTLKPSVYNEYTSYVVDESPEEVIQSITSILSKYSNDIEFNVDKSNYIISGMVFVKNMAVYFKISVWRENENGTQSRFECRRTKGDNVQYQEFWNECYKHIKLKLHLQPKDDDIENDEFMASMPSMDDMNLESENENDFGLMSLDYNFDLEMDLDSDSMSIPNVSLTNEDLDNFIMDIEEDDPSSIYSIGLILDSIEDKSTIDAIHKHAKFIKCVIQKALRHQDAALSRGSLICLEKICSDKTSADKLVSFNVLDEIIPLLQHESNLIRKYAIRVLSKLTTANQWKLNRKNLKRFAQESLKENQQRWEDDWASSDDQFVNQQMFKNINMKLFKI